MFISLPFCTTENSKFTSNISSKSTFEKICCSKNISLYTIICKTFFSGLCSQNRSDLLLIRQNSNNFSNFLKLVDEVPKIVYRRKLSNRSAASSRRKRQEVEDELDSRKRIEESIDKSLEALDNLSFHLSDSLKRNLSNPNQSDPGKVPKLEIHPSQSNDSAPSIPQKRQEIEDEFDSKKLIDASLDESLENRNLDEDNEELLDESDDHYLVDELQPEVPLEAVGLKKGLDEVEDDLIEPRFKEMSPELLEKPKDRPEVYAFVIPSLYSLIGLILSAIVIILPIYTFCLVALMYRYTTTVITE